MRDAVDVEITIRVALVVADLSSHTLGKNLGPPAWKRVQSCIHERSKCLLIGHLVQVGKERNFDRREALQVNTRADLFEAAQQVRVVTEGQSGIESVDDVELGERLI